MGAPRNSRTIPEGIANINALVRSNIQTMDAPERVEWTCRYLWGRANWHVIVVEAVLEREEQSGPQYKMVRVISDVGGPPTNARKPPDSMGIAWFALPEHLANGKIKVIK